MITIADYGAGNLRSVQNTLEEIGAEFEVVQTLDAIRKADKIVLPGVGHFGQMTAALDRLNIREALKERIRAGIPFLGICVGLQCLFESSEESPGAEGLGIFPGAVRRFNGDVRVPHMGWNSLRRVKTSVLLSGLPEEIYTYFAHSYYAPVIPQAAATCEHAQTYTALIESGNVYAVQFHPEKSGAVGLRVLRNFVRLNSC